MLSLLPSQTHWSSAGYLAPSFSLKLGWCAWPWSSTWLRWGNSKEHVLWVHCRAKLQCAPHQGSGSPHGSSMRWDKSLFWGQPAIRGGGTDLGIKHWDASSCFLLRYFSFQNTYFMIYSVHCLPLTPDRMGTLQLLFKDWRILSHSGTFSFIDVPQIPTGWQLSDAVSSHHTVPGTSSLCGVRPWLQLVTKKTFFQALIVKALPLKALKDLLDLYFITMNLLASTFIFQTSETYS